MVDEEQHGFVEENANSSTGKMATTLTVSSKNDGSDLCLGCPLSILITLINFAWRKRDSDFDCTMRLPSPLCNIE